MCQVKIQHSYAIHSSEILRPADLLFPISVLRYECTETRTENRSELNGEAINMR